MHTQAHMRLCAHVHTQLARHHRLCVVLFQALVEETGSVRKQLELMRLEATHNENRAAELELQVARPYLPIEHSCFFVFRGRDFCGFCSSRVLRGCGISSLAR